MDSLTLINRGMRHAKLAPLRSIDQNGDQAAEARELIPLAIREALEQDWNWTFAKRRVALTLVPDATYAEWEYLFDLPDDVVQVRALYDTGSTTPKDPDLYEFLRNRDDADRAETRVAMDVDECDVVYTGMLTVVPDLPMYFANAVAWLMAYYMADAFAGTERAAYCYEMYMMKIREARARDHQRITPNVKGEYTLVDE